MDGLTEINVHLEHVPSPIICHSLQLQHKALQWSIHGLETVGNAFWQGSHYTITANARTLLKP